MQGNQNDLFDVKEEKLLYSEIFEEIDINSVNSQYRVGVIDFCNYKNAFINQGFEKSKVINEGLAVIFNPKLIRCIPKSIEFETKSHIYLVLYAVSGTVKNSKTGLEHPAMDYSIPIKIIRTIPRKKCAYIRSSSEEVIIGHLHETKKSIQEFTPESYVVLDELFENGKYVDFLASDIMKKVKPQELPMEYWEKALTCAHRLLYPESMEFVSLNVFQQELINNATTMMFIKKWKTEEGFSESIIEQCGETAIAHFDYPENSALIVKLLKEIGAKNTLNNNYVGITDRFVACENKLIPHFYVLLAFVQNSKTSIQKIVSEYCQIVKNIKQSTSGPRMTDELRLCSFEKVLKIIHSNILDCSQFAPKIRINIASVYVEYDKMCELQEIMSLLDREKISPEWRLVDMYFNPNTWTEQKFVQLIRDGVSRELLQRCIALLWRESISDNILDVNYLNILSWIILYDDYTSIDEVLRYSSGKSLSKIDKQNMLINMFEFVCDCAANNNNMYVLASYIIFFIQAYVNANNATTEETEKLDIWNKFSSDFYAKKTRDLKQITSETESCFIDLFTIFKMDIPNYLKLQAQYAEWFIQLYPPSGVSIEDVASVYDELYNKGAYAAFVDYYTLDSRIEIEEVRKKYTTQYIESLINLHRYNDAISFLWDLQSLTDSVKNGLLIRAVGENFRENGISPKAFSRIGDVSIREKIINILLVEFKPTQSLIINSLIALYVYEKKYMNAAYLLTVFGTKVDKGFVRLYGQIRSQLGRYMDFNKLKSHYHVIAYAFQVLKANDLVTFLKWANEIPIPNYKDNKQGHIFSSFYYKIMIDPTNKEAWGEFLNHLVEKGIERNAWNICVCETVLRQVLHECDSNHAQRALDYILNNESTASYSPNFLPYAFEIIKGTQSAFLCRRLVDVLSDNILFQHIITSNNWLNFYEENIKAFKQYCQDMYATSGNSAFHEILPLLGTELNALNIKETSQSSISKPILFTRICNNYLNDCDVSETIEILFSDDWIGLTENEYALLNILRIIYSDDDTLLLDEDALFEDEETVRRFKRDCAEIMSTYPEKKGLFAFDKACNNDTYKLLVYTYVFNVFFDQDIYKSFDKRFSDLADVQSFKTYLRFLGSSYKAQTIRNTTFPFFYKKWRYLKWYLSLVLVNPANVDDSDILSQMEKNGHYDEVYTDSYVPFVETVKRFWELDELSQEFKNHFLFALMVSCTKELYDEHAQVLREMSSEYKIICRKMIACLDYRDFNTSLFKYLSKDISVGEFSNAIPLAEAVSEYAFDTLIALKDSFNDSTKLIFKQLMSVERGALLLSKVASMDVSEMSKYRNWIVPLTCARQFDFLINDRFRSLVIMQRDDLVCEKYKFISDYLVQKGKAKGIYSYLCALLACIKKDAEKARYIVDGIDFNTHVPKQWLHEANQIIEYANGTSKNFKADKSIVDGSQENTKKKIEVSFAEELLKTVFAENIVLPSKEEVLEIYHNYLEANEAWERLKFGLKVLLWLNKKTGDAETSIPSVNDFALKVGLELLRPEINLTIENRLLIITELYKNRQAYADKVYRERMENLKSKLLTLINNGFALSLWIRYDKIIEDFLREENILMDFAKIRTQILSKCDAISKPEISYEEKKKRYEDLLKAFSGLTSPYSTSVKRAIKEEKEKLQNGILLNIKIENTETTDNCIYFRIYNEGRRTVSFSQDALTIELQQENQPNDESIEIRHIPELQSGTATGGKASLVVKDSDKQISVKMNVFYKAPNGQKELVCSTEESIVVGCACNPYVPVEAVVAAGDSVNSAVLDDNLLFGRENEKKLLTAFIPKGVTLIYGPSRIGKTSLMNWIRYKHAIDKGNVMTILIGGEEGLGKKRDYTHNFIDEKKSVPYDDPGKMSQYLLVDTIVYGLSTGARLGLPSKVEIPDNLVTDMLNDLLDTGTTITTKYDKINRRLQNEKIELWLLLDEFQQVVERWKKIPGWCDFVTICSLLSSQEKKRGKLKNINIVFCGSDDLLTHMILKRDSVWKNTFRYSVAVKALEPVDFGKMIRKDPAISHTNLKFSDDAIEALCQYTGGIALYGKEICRAILEDISANSQNWGSRNRIFTFDVAKATQQLLHQQDDELSAKGQEGISSIYDAVKQNLNENTDMQLLWYMAMWINKNPQQEGFPERNFTDMKPKFKKYWKDFLKIVIARDIIKKDEEKYPGETIYFFKTLFYYYAFRGSAPKDILQNNDIFLKEDSQKTKKVEDDQITEPYEFNNIIKIAPKFDDWYSAKEQCAFLGALSLTGDEKVRFALRQLAGTNIINVNECIINSFDGIFAAEGDVAKIINSLQKLPRLDSYLDKDSGMDKETLFENLKSDNPELVSEAETKLELSTTRMVSDYLAALVSQNDVPKDFCIWEQLRISEIQYKILTKKLAPSFVAELILAAKLDHIFGLAEKGQEGDSVKQDYSPVSIMYCKVLEKMLKYYHTDIYISRFPNNLTQVKEDDRKYKFKDLGEMGVQEKLRIQNKILLGAFLYPIDPCRELTEEQWLEIANGNEDQADLWEKHGHALPQIRDIRNNSAHGAEGIVIDKDTLLKLKKLLFEEEGLKTIVELR